jgi:diguanylate cyclase (GGDEF)-like protein
VSAALEMPGDARRAREDQLYATDHAALGRQVAERLGLPDPFPAAIGLHHDRLEVLAAAVGGGLAAAVAAAAAVPHKVESAHRATQPLTERLRGMMGGNVGAADVLRVLKDVTGGYAATVQELGGDDADESGGAFKRFLHEVTAEVAGSMAAAVIDARATIVGLQSRQAGLTDQVAELKQQVARSELDGLTGVLNRSAFDRRLPLLLAAARTARVECHIGFAYIDNFKRVNDTHGHALGDEAIRAVAARLTDAVKGRGIIARMGGDEFAFVIVGKGTAAADVAAAVAERFAKIDVICGAATTTISASTGLFNVGVPGPEDTAEAVLARADRLMYEVKRSGKGRCLTAAAERPAA